ncbi:hypothetical protein B7463_g1400, partial [Scytalidium lignicola]
MAGRRRRFSTISVEGEGEAPPIHYVNESSVLKSVAKVPNPDDWPCFLLEDAVVYWKDGETLGNILDAELQGTYMVRGRLEVEKENRKYLLNKKAQSTYIEIRESQAYSIGYGPTTIWASGKSGWFEIRPAPAYQDIYNRILEGIDIYYAVIEAYEELEHVPRRKGYRNILTVDEILLKYAMKDGTGLTRSEVIERIQSHASFLLTHMRKEKLVNFENTGFYKWLKIRCPEIYQRLQRQPLILAPGVMNQARKGTSPTPASPSPETPLTERLSTPPIPEPQDLSVTGIIVNFILEADRSGQRKRHAMRIGPLSTSLYCTYKLPSRVIAQSIIRKRAQEILDALDNSWKTTPIYAELTEITRQSLQADVSQQDIDVKDLVKREKRVIGSTNKLSTVERNPRKAKASPQPHSSKSLPLLHPARKTGGKVASLRLVSSPLHPDNLGTDSTSSDEDISHARKRRKPSTLSSDEDDGAQQPPPYDSKTSTNILPSEDDDPSKTSRKQESEALTLTSTFLPSLVPTGPNGTWTCSEPNCNAVIRAAHTPDGKREIQDHFLHHARLLAQVSRETLVKKESIASRLPVNHLLEKLKNLGREVAEPPASINGRIVPQPIKRETTA